MRKRLICFVLACNMLFPVSAIQALAEGPETIPFGMEENEMSEGTDAEDETNGRDETFDQNSNEIHVIRGFGDFDIQGHYISVTEDKKPDEKELTAQMPKTLEVFLDNSTTTVSIPVSWTCVEDYDHSEYYYYQFSPCFDPELYELDSSIDILKDAPYIGVFLQSEDASGISSYALTSDSLGTGATGNKNEPVIFEYLVNEKGVNAAAVCGILANLEAESSFRPNNLQNSCEDKLGYTDDTYTEAVDSGEYTNFADDSAGYGLCQWTSSGRKKKLLEFAQNRGCSIADMEMQLDFMMEELQSYSKAYNAITSAELSGDGAYDVGYAFCYYYEAPANKENISVTRGNQARDTYWEYYKDFIDDDKPDTGKPQPGEQIADADYTGLTMYHDELYYARDGAWDSSYTGFADYQGTTYYVQSGQVDQTFTGLVEQDGTVYYVEKGRIKPDFTGIVYLDDKGYYIVDGIWASDCTSLVKYDDIWYYIVDGVLADDYTGLVKYYSTWYYVEKGVLNWDYTGLTKYYSTWYYVEKGILNWDYTGLVKHYSTWYYVEKGILNWDYTGLVKHYSTWYYVEKGILNWDYTGLTKYYSTWYYVEKGVLNWDFTGVTKYYSTWYYVEKGVLNWDFTGTITFNGQKWKVVKGVATLIEDPYSAISDVKTAELYWVTANTLNVRSGAGTDYEKQGTTSRWDKYIVIEKKDNWGKIIYNDTFGWISLDYATCENPFPDYPICFNRTVKTDINDTIAHQCENTFGESGNSREAYEAAAQAGCFGIEGDFDNGYIMSHFGEYSSCDVSSYLDICKKYKKLAVVDMKDCTQSDVTRLVETIIEKDMLDQVIFQASGINKFKLLEKASKSNDNCYLRTWYLAASSKKVDELSGTDSDYIHYSDLNKYNIECVNMDRAVPDSQDIIGIQKTGTAVCLYTYIKSEVPEAADLGANLVMVDSWD